MDQSQMSVNDLESNLNTVKNFSDLGDSNLHTMKTLKNFDGGE